MFRVLMGARYGSHCVRMSLLVLSLISTVYLSIIIYSIVNSVNKKFIVKSDTQQRQLIAKIQ